MNFLGKCCEYIGEGNAHIVLRVVGTYYVLRLIKEDNEPIDLVTVKTSTAFVNSVMIPLLSTNNYPKYDVIKIPDSEITEISIKLQSIRPEKRKYKSKLSRFAVQALNLLSINPHYSTNYCIEIKPKEGFISSSLKGSPKCYYCLKQFLKLNDNQIDNISEYCPLDLFSGDKGRMKCALLNLIKNPQNNFKLFRNEQIIYGEKSSPKTFNDIINSTYLFNGSVMLFIDFLIEILINDNNKCEIMCNDESNIMNVENKGESCIEKCKLPFDSFLYKLLDVQKWSEKYYLENSCSDIGDKEYVSTILRQIETQNLDLKSDANKEIFLATTNTQHLALISAVAKDCSIMISFSPDSTKEFPSVKVGDSEIAHRVAVTDLEPKSVKSLTKRNVTEKTMLKIYQEYVETTGKCDI